jgi:uncharacterized protein (TIGR00251 family)
MSEAATVASPFAAVSDGVRVRLRLQPRARRNLVVGLAPEADGGVALKVAVTAAPEDGKANAAMIALLAAQWDMPKSALTIVSGASDRRKTVHVWGDAPRLLQALQSWLKQSRISA